ncbi:SCP2 sterol-binding domain-containing protein [Xylaria sp. CBS 124048]|nr:SCP2 sterol-binding domain-containing protein [Xylaria sp. CBS 124048]
MPIKANPIVHIIAPGYHFCKFRPQFDLQHNGFRQWSVSRVFLASANGRTLTKCRTAKFPASAAFDVINSALNVSEAERKDAIKQGSGVYAFVLKNKAGETETWHIDLKEKGAVGTGLGNKPNVTLLLSDEDFGKLVTGKANAQRLFMSGKLKIKGDVMKATKLDPILKKAQTKAKL